MKQGSRARHKERYQRFTREAGGAALSRASGDLGAALALAAASEPMRGADPATVAGASEDRRDPPRTVASEPRQHAPRPHIEDDFFARGEAAGSFPPASVDTFDVGADHVAHRPVS